MSRRTLRCLRCGGTMELLRREFLQLGKTGWVLGDLDNLLAAPKFNSTKGLANYLK